MTDNLRIVKTGGDGNEEPVYTVMGHGHTVLAPVGTWADWEDLARAILIGPPISWTTA